MPDFPNANVNGNTREHKVRTFLSKPPKRATRLVMAAKDEEGEAAILEEWQRDEVRPELATHILDVLAEHAAEVGGAVQVRLVYLANDGSEVSSMLLNLQASKIETASDLMNATVQGDGRSLVVQAQVQSLAVQKVYLNALGQVLSVSQNIATRANDQAEGYLRRIVDLEHENDGLKDAIRAAEEIAAAGGPPPDGPVSETQARMLRVIEQLAPILMQKLLTAGGSPSAPMPS